MNPSSPDSPTPAAPRSRLWLLSRIAAAVVVVAFGLSVWPQIAKQKKAAERTTAISSLKGIGLCLQQFQSEYGRFPDESTAAIVKAATKTNLDLSGTSTNRLFRQFLATGLKSEKPFYAPLPGHRRGDDRYEDDAHALAPGEVGFAYLTSDLSGDWSSSAIIALAPLIHGTNRFDSMPFENKAVILRLDNSASAVAIGPDGQAMTMEGENILDPDQKYWSGHPPVIHWYEEPGVSR